MKLLIRLFILISLLFTGLFATDPMLREKAVNFTVVDPEGNPVENAYLEASKPGVVKLEAYTDRNGKASLLLAEGASLAL